MKKFILFTLVSLSVSSSFAADFICNHGRYSAMTVALQLDGATGSLKILKSGNAQNKIVYPQAKESAVLTPVQSGSANYLLLESEGTYSKRGFEISILKSDLAKESFRAVLSASELENSTTYSQFELTCVRQ